MKAQENDPDSASPVGQIIGQAALLKGESKEDYEALRREVYRLLKPADLFDEMQAMDLVNSHWESRRMRQIAVNLISNGRITALGLLLDPLLGENTCQGHEMARRFFAGNKKEKEVARKLVELNRITEPALQAQAYLINSIPIAMLDRGISNRETLRRSLLKEHARKLKKAEKAKRKEESSPHRAAFATTTSATLAATSASDKPAAGSSVGNNDNAGSPEGTPDFPKRNLKRRGGV